MKLDIRYTDYFPEYAKYIGRTLRLLNSMYGVTNFGKLFADELTELLLEADFIQYQCQMSIYYNYATYGSKVVVLSYVDDCVHWCTNEYIGKWFVDTLGTRFHVNFLGYAHWFMSIIISQISGTPGVRRPSLFLGYPGVGGDVWGRGTPRRPPSPLLVILPRLLR